MIPDAKVAVLVGSLRKDSLTPKMAHAVASVHAAPLSFEIVEIGDLALYNPDLKGESAPASWLRLRRQISDSDAPGEIN